MKYRISFSKTSESQRDPDEGFSGMAGVACRGSQICYGSHMALLNQEGLISVEDYLAGELVSEMKHEYLGGVVHAMSGGKVRHSAASGNVFLGLGSRLRGKSCQPYNSDLKVRLDLPTQTRFYYPDLQVICESLDDDASFQDKPVVVVEVLSDSSRRVDLGEKRDAYPAVASLKVLMMIDPARPWIQLDRRSANGGFSQEFYQSLEDVILLPEIECELPVEEIYEGITLA